MSLKLKIMKNLGQIEWPEFNEDRKKPLHLKAMDLEDSVLFHSIERHAKTDARDVDLRHTPFDDCMFLIPIVSGTIEEGNFRTDNHLVRLIQNRADNTTDLIVYWNSGKNLVFKPMMGFTIHDDIDYELVFPTKPITYSDGSVIDIVQDSEHVFVQMERVLREVLWVTMRHERMIIEDPTRRHSFKKKVKPTDAFKYIEYTLDMSKRVRYTRPAHLGGTHASPVEHVRAGTWVTSKTGKRFYRRGTVVNEGSTSGRVEKDYTASLGE